MEPTEIRLKYEASLAMLQLNATDEWICFIRKSNHQKILDEQPQDINITELDCDRIKRSLAAWCIIRILSRESWLGLTFLKFNPGIHFDTDGSKVVKRTILGFYDSDIFVGKCSAFHNTITWILLISKGLLGI